MPRLKARRPPPMPPPKPVAEETKDGVMKHDTLKRASGPRRRDGEGRQVHGRQGAVEAVEDAPPAPPAPSSSPPPMPPPAA